LVTITIIGMLAAMTMGALQMARNSAREAATKATIAKLNTIIMRRYESYMTRRVPIQMVYPAGNPNAGQPLTPKDAAITRLAALRDLMRMEMPDFYTDITSTHLTPYTSLLTSTPHDHDPLPTLTTEPALWKLYNTIYNRTVHAPGTDPAENAKCLYLVVSVGSPEAMEQFHESEIAADASDRLNYFVDGWGRPIYWLRWAPGFSNGSGAPTGPTYPPGASPPAPSDVQTGDPVNDHDPFDTRKVDTNAFRLVPLIYSGGSSGVPGVSWGQASQEWAYTGNPYQSYPDSQQGTMWLGSIVTAAGKQNTGIINNHHIEAR
jgi:type II secretory pathway pseudopilin PulG